MHCISVKAEEEARECVQITAVMEQVEGLSQPLNVLHCWRANLAGLRADALQRTEGGGG